MREVELKKLAVGPGGIDAGRSLFEQMVVDLVGVMHPGCRGVRSDPGDWGIDAYVGQLEPGGKVDIWQAKFFLDGFEKTQKDQIRGSYQQAVKEARRHGYEVASWTLCVPCSLSGPETKWWNNWKRREGDNVDKELWTLEQLRRLLLAPEAGWIYDSYLSNDPKDRPKRKVVELPEGGRYDRALFIRQMIEAGIGGNPVLADAKRAYFNAELVEADVVNRQSQSQREELQQVRTENQALWTNAFVAASADSESKAASMYASVFAALRSYHEGAAAGSLRLHFIHRDGVMHQLVDEGAAGWSLTYEQIAEAHAS